MRRPSRGCPGGTSGPAPGELGARRGRRTRPDRAVGRDARRAGRDAPAAAVAGRPWAARDWRARWILTSGQWLAEPCGGGGGRRAGASGRRDETGPALLHVPPATTLGSGSRGRRPPRGPWNRFVTPDPPATSGTSGTPRRTGPSPRVAARHRTVSCLSSAGRPGQGRPAREESGSAAVVRPRSTPGRPTVAGRRPATPIAPACCRRRPGGPAPGGSASDAAPVPPVRGTGGAGEGREDDVVDGSVTLGVWPGRDHVRRYIQRVRGSRT